MRGEEEVLARAAALVRGVPSNAMVLKNADDTSRM
jgi:hypothetical protein